MKGKLKEILSKDNLKAFSKKVFSKKGIRVFAAAVVIVFAVIGVSSVVHLGGRSHDKQFARGAQSGQLQPGNGQQGQRQMQGKNGVRQGTQGQNGQGQDGTNQNMQNQKGSKQGRQPGNQGQGPVDGTAGASQNPGTPKADGQKQ